MDSEKRNVDYKTMMSIDSDFYIAQDISEYGSKIYYNLSLKELRKVLESDNHLYEIIKEDKPCKMYFDFDGSIKDVNEDVERIRDIIFDENLSKHIQQHLKDFCEDYGFPIPMCAVSDSSTDVKRSLHIVIKNIILRTNKHRQAFFNKFIKYIDGDEIIKFLDSKVYTKNRLMRMINQSKLGKNVTLKSTKKSKLTSHVITYTKDEDISEIPEDWIPAEKVYIPMPKSDDVDICYDEIKMHLKNISRNKDYKDWSCVGQVLLNLTNASEDGLELFDNWSKSAPNYDYGACEQFWYRNKPNSNYNIGLLISMKDEEEPVKLLPSINLISDDDDDEHPVKKLLGNRKVSDKDSHTVESPLVNDDSHTVQSPLVNDDLNNDWIYTFIHDISDMHCAEIFANHSKGEVFYTTGYGWILFNKKTKFWTLKNEKSALIYPISKFFSEHVKNLHINFIKEYNPKDETDNKTLKLIIKTQKYVESSKFSKNILDHLQNIVLCDNTIIDKFDNMPNLIAFKDGFVIDLNNDGKSRPIRKEDFLITHTGYNLPTKNEYYNKIYDIIRTMVETDDDMNSLLSLLATFIYGDNINEMFFVLTGTGGNGKGVLDKMLQLCLGGYYKTIDIKQLTNYEKDNSGTRANSELFNCRLARCVMSSEPETGSTSNKLITSTIKKWTGKDPITCRDLHKSSITYTPKFTLAINVNEIPLLSTKDGGIERRMRCYKLPFQFVINNGQELGPKEKYRDDNLKTLLSSDEYRDQIILVLVDGWLKNKGKFYESKNVAEFTSNYMNEQNPIKEWFLENYEISETARINSSELYTQFKSIGGDISNTSFGRYMKELCQSVKSSGVIKYKCTRKSKIIEF